MQKDFNRSSSSLESSNDQGNQAVVSEVPVVMEVTAQTAVSISLKYTVSVMKWNVISLPLEHSERLFSPPIQEIWAPIFTYDHFNYLSVILCYIMKFSFCTVEIVNSEKRGCPFLEVITTNDVSFEPRQHGAGSTCSFTSLSSSISGSHHLLQQQLCQHFSWCKGRRSLYF